MFIGIKKKQENRTVKNWDWLSRNNDKDEKLLKLSPVDDYFLVYEIQDINDILLWFPAQN